MSASRTDFFPQHLLFREQLPHLKSEGPLFRNQLDLSEAIADVSGTTYTGKASSVRALLSQVFRHGGDKHSRPLPPALKEAIIKAVKQRATNNFNWSDFNKRFDIAFENLKSEWRDGDAMPSDILEKKFDAVSKLARKHWIITRQPAELHPNEFGERLADRLVEKLHEGSAEFTFCFADKLVALSFWRELRDRIERAPSSSNKHVSTKGKGKGSRRSGDDILTEWNEKGQIKVFFSEDMRLFLHPYVIFDYDRESREGFVLHYHGSTGVSISMMRREDLEFWKSYEFDALIDSMKPMTYQDVLSAPM